MKATFSGMRAWALQRATAVVLLAFTLYLLLQLLIAPPATAAAWRGWILHPVMRVALMAFFVALALHAWVGMRDVVLDYIKPFYLRLAVLGAVVAGLATTVIWAASLLLLPS